MKTKIQDMTSGSPGRLIILFAIHLPPIEEGEFLLYIMLKLTTKNRVSASPVIPHEKIYKRYSDEIVWKCANTV